MEKVAIRTREGSLLRDPMNYNVVTEGYLVDIKQPFWQRRLKAGDIELVDTKAKVKKEEKVEEILVEEKPKKTRRKRGEK